MLLNTTHDRLRADPMAAELVGLFETNEHAFGIEDASLYYKFPLYRDDDQIITAKLILVSRNHGVFVFATIDDMSGDHQPLVEDADNELDTVFGQLHARLTKQRSLRKDKKALLFNFEPAIYAPGFHHDEFREIPTPIISSREQLAAFLADHRLTNPLEDIFRDICSVIEGAKGLVTPRPRDVTGRAATSKAALVNQLEAEIRNFDREQKQGYMEVFSGPQRIRGLAGSGKTVVLAMKAALTHLKDPNAYIVYTFYTRSLYQHVRRLITRFYRQYNDQDPDWERLRVMHAWGGKSKQGLYFQACVDHGVPALTYSDVSRQTNPFDSAVSTLLENATIKPSYDYVFVDEGQDFPTSFLRMALQLARDSKFVYAYDELQNIFQTEVPSSESIFGAGFELDEDVVLKKCYRNSREVLVCAHSLGFGLYSDRIVQMLENKEHWEDLGYEVKSGRFVEGETLDIERPAENSPNSISSRVKIGDLVRCSVLSTAGEEIAFVAAQVTRDILEEGLTPEDVVVICADDRYARNYFSQLSTQLNARGIRTNNLNADSYSGDVFTREKAVTLSSIHRAKGNEGYSVYVMGADALFHQPNVRSRNLIFTAMTRAKAWLCVTGVGPAAERFKSELDAAKLNFPHLKFGYPSEGQLTVMKRDLSETAHQKLERALAEVIGDISEEDVKKLMARLSSVRKKKFEE